MTYVCFVRHGETEWNLQKRVQGTTNTELTAKGIAQAKQAAFFLKQYKWDHIITSPLKRAVQTAEIIASELTIGKINKWPEFQERQYGDATGLYFDEFQKLFNSGQKIKNWENNEDLVKRIILGLRKLVDLFPDGKIIVISHGVPILAILEYISKTKLSNDIFYLKNGCLNFISYEDKIWKIDQYNVTKHLYGIDTPENTGT